MSSTTTTTTTTSILRTSPPVNEEESKNESDGVKEEEEEGAPSKKQPSPAQLLPLLPSFSAGLSKKASAWQLQSWVALALTLDGRDKITKVIQYAARLLSWYFAGRGLTGLAKRCLALKTSLTNSRKAFRLGRGLMEYHKLRNAGLGVTLLWHLKQLLLGDEATPPSPPPSKTLERQASSNIGWGPSNSAVVVEPPQQQRRTFYRSMSSMLLQSFGADAIVERRTATPLWKLMGSCLKLLGLLGFWTFDNINFLALSGLFDNHQSKEATAARRKQIQSQASVWANRSYFMGAVAGLFVNLHSYWSFLVQENTKLREDDDDEDLKRTKALRQKQFTLFLALLKSCCDVLVFSNMTGIDLWKKHRNNKKMHEGFHCVCGLVSASTVLYNNFPNNGK